jgi:hypothetical protein
MYVRIARFEGGDPAKFDEEIAEMKRQLAAVRSGGVPADAPEGLRVLGETVTRFLQLVDRRTRRSMRCPRRTTGQPDAVPASRSTRSRSTSRSSPDD